MEQMKYLSVLVVAAETKSSAVIECMHTSSGGTRLEMFRNGPQLVDRILCEQTWQKIIAYVSAPFRLLCNILPRALSRVSC